MSATFPYVSPAARVVRHALSDEQNHYVDGGYYDNYGTATMIQWLESGLERKLDHSPSTILMIEIRSFPDTQPSEHGAARGWVADVVQPLRTLYEVRGSGQAAHSLLNVHLMEDDWNFWSIPIIFPPQPPGSRDDEAPPLSWHLTLRDQRAIVRAWDDADVKKSRVQIQEFLGRSEAYARGCIG
jgi:hypothetical protein